MSKSNRIQVFKNNDTDESPVSEGFRDVGKSENAVFKDNCLHPFFNPLHIVRGEETPVIEPNLLPVLQTGTTDLKSVWRASTIAPENSLDEASEPG